MELQDDPSDTHARTHARTHTHTHTHEPHEKKVLTGFSSLSQLLYSCSEKSSYWGPHYEGTAEARQGLLASLFPFSHLKEQAHGRHNLFNHLLY